MLNSNSDTPQPMNYVGQWEHLISVHEFGSLVGLPEDDVLSLQRRGGIPVEGTAGQWLRAYCEYLRARCVHPPEAPLKKHINLIDVSGVYLRDQIKCADICIRGWVSFGDQTDDFLDQVAALDVDELFVRIDSLGGEHHTGVSIYRALKQHRAFVTVIVEGEAASAASTIAMAGDRVALVPGAQIMIHSCSFSAIGGNHNMFQSCAEALRRFDAEMHAIYAAKSGRSTEFFQMMMSDDRNHWLTADEAIALGLADTICETADAVYRCGS
jgi:ATP-dependent protease ClpP protease subunit